MRVDRFVAISALAAARVRQHYGLAATVVYPPVDIARFRLRAAAGSYAVCESYAVCVGELVPYKRFDLAIRAARKAKRRLVVVGDGPARRELEALAKGADIVFVGRVSDEDVVDLICEAEVLIHPGVEDFGIVMVEALAAGVPVIANQGGGAAEILTDSTGLLIADGDVDGLAEALHTSRKVRWDRSALRERAARFDVDRFRREFSAVVREIYAVSTH